VRRLGRCAGTSYRDFENLTCGVRALGLDLLNGSVTAGSVTIRELGAKWGKCVGIAGDGSSGSSDWDAAGGR